MTFFTGSLFFTAAAFLTYREAVDAGPHQPVVARRRFSVFQPSRINWWATAVQLAGTVFFNVSTGIAMVSDLSRAGRAPARVAPRRLGLGLLTGRQRAGLVRGLPRLGGLASGVLILVAST